MLNLKKNIILFISLFALGCSFPAYSQTITYQVHSNVKESLSFNATQSAKVIFTYQTHTGQVTSHEEKVFYVEAHPTFEFKNVEPGSFDISSFNIFYIDTNSLKRVNLICRGFKQFNHNNSQAENIIIHALITMPTQHQSECFVKNTIETK